MKVLITGSSGFVGSRLVELAEERDWDVVRVVRKVSQIQPNSILVPSIDSTTDWSGAFDGIDCLVHCAARVHQMNETEQEAKEAYHEVNTLGTLNLARQAAMNGVTRFVFISSIKVNGEQTEAGEPFKPNLTRVPIDPYGLSKYEAEVGLRQIAEETGLEVVIIRPPLVYGPGVKANFLSMIRCVDNGIPLPLGAIYNKRSFVYVDNLVDLMLICSTHSQAAGETFLVSDGTDVSTTQLLVALAAAMSRKSRLLTIPMSLIDFSTKLVGKPQISLRLCGSLQVDISHTHEILGWVPSVTFEGGIERTVQAYLDTK
ncbi:SDR family oxidoreductase [Vibrio sp. 1CM2L]|uniref:UDP-glucose 4-epimerase family protein n=1 Tax=Vibrio sp. 1CM2L TaxID=2929166 RepID=UPI0020BD6044|nr:SDR family oxidoreductase [Vibrio sp. 1CM2L]MCK8078705.1 SDR family oxidoreductase [Vibrio sp. 1CM2L]